MGNADGSRVGESDDAVGTHIVAAQHQCASIELQVAISGGCCTNCALLPAIVEVGHDECSAINDCLSCVVAILQIESHIGVFINGHTALARDASIARERVGATIEDNAAGHNLVVDGNVLT